MADVARPNRVDETAIEKRRQQVAALYLAHQSLRAIANHLGVDHSTVGYDLQELRREWRRENLEMIGEVQLRELAELDQMEQELVIEWRKTREMGWIERRLKIKERRAKMLGLDAPIPFTNVSPDGDLSAADQLTRARHEFAEILMALAAGGDAAASLEARLALDSETIEGRLGDISATEPAPAAGDMALLADHCGPGFREDEERR